MSGIVPQNLFEYNYDSPNQPLAHLSSQMTAVLSKLKDLLDKVDKIKTISKDVAVIKAEVSNIREGLTELEPRVARLKC